MTTVKNTKIKKEKKEKVDDVKLPKTKKQKLKSKHKRLIMIVCGLIIILVGIIVLNLINEKNKDNDNKVSTKKKDKTVETLNVYDVNSNMRPYAVMIPNDAEAKKRQYGIQNAYLVYEITVEGGITRLMALYKDVKVDKIGPTRSSRHYYLDYALESDAIYVHFGWSPYAQSDIKSLGINNLNGLYNPSNMFWRDKQYSAPNNAFTNTDNIKKAAEDKKYRTTSDSYQLLKYKKNVDLSSDETYKAATNVKVDYLGSSVKYLYDEANKYYLRYNGDNPHIDLNTNEQVHVKNIIVMNMGISSIAGDEKGRQELYDVGNGEGYLITNGQSIEITWSKSSRDAKTVYKNKKGEEINVDDGNTFIQIKPTSKSVTIE